MTDGEIRGALDKWDLTKRSIAAVVVGLTAAIGAPPAQSLSGHPIEWPYIAALFATATVLFLWRSFGRGDYLLGGTMFIGFILLLFYVYIRLQWSCELEQGWVIVGERLTAAATELKGRAPNSTCRDFLENFASDPRRVYEQSELNYRYVVLGGLYLITMIVLVISLLWVSRRAE